MPADYLKIGRHGDTEAKKLEKAGKFCILSSGAKVNNDYVLRNK